MSKKKSIYKKWYDAPKDDEGIIAYPIKKRQKKSKGWPNEPTRHALASRGVQTVRQEDVFVGGKDEPRTEFKGISKTDIPGVFHTTLDENIAIYFADVRDKDYIWRLNLDYSQLPDEKVLKREDWTKELVETFAKTGRLDLNELKKVRPDLVKEIYEESDIPPLGNSVSAHELGREKPISIFFYPPKEMVDELSRSDRGSLNEQEVAILDKDYLRKLWRTRKKDSKRGG